MGWTLFILSLIMISLSTVGYDFECLEVKTFALIDSSVLGESRTGYFKIIETNITYTLIGTLFIIGGLLIAFSKEKEEDEFIANLRLSSFQWAVFINYILLLLGFILVYGIDFLTVITYNVFTILILFILRFNYLLYINKKLGKDEK